MSREMLKLHAIRDTPAQCGRQYSERSSMRILGFYYQELAPDKSALAYARRCRRHVEKTAPYIPRGPQKGWG